jgi:hypothetical protein
VPTECEEGAEQLPREFSAEIRKIAAIVLGDLAEFATCRLAECCSHCEAKTRGQLDPLANPSYHDTFSISENEHTDPQ